MDNIDERLEYQKQIIEIIGKMKPVDALSILFKTTIEVALSIGFKRVQLMFALSEIWDEIKNFEAMKKRNKNQGPREKHERKQE